jgi:putative hydrolase of the HAD superfamily
MTEELDAVFFDAGGTLWDVQPSPVEMFGKALSRRGANVELSSLAEARRKADWLFDKEFAKLTPSNEDEFWIRYDEFVLKELGLDMDAAELALELNDEIGSVMNKVESWTAFPDAHPLLAKLERRDLVVGLISNATVLARRVLDNLDMTKYFDHIVLSDEVRVRKPNPEIFWIAAKQAGVLPSRSLYIGDKLATDIVGARAAGFNAMLVDRANVFPDANVIKFRDLRSVQAYL